MIISYTVPEIWHVMDVIVVSHFGHFLPLLLRWQPKKWKFQTMKKTPGDIIILHKCTKNHDHMLCYPWDMAHGTCNCCFLFWAIFFPFTPLTAPKNKVSKKWTWRYHHFTHVYRKLWLNDARFLRYGGRQVNGRKKWHIEVGAPPKYFITLKYHVMIYYKNFITSTLLDIGPKAFSERG